MELLCGGDYFSMMRTADELCVFPICVSILAGLILWGNLFHNRTYELKGPKSMCLSVRYNKTKTDEYSFGMRTSKSETIK